MGPRAGLDRCGKSRPTGIRSPDRPARRQSLYRLRYPAHKVNYLHLKNTKRKYLINGLINRTTLGDEYKLMTHSLHNNTERPTNHTKLTATSQEYNVKSRLT